MGKVKKTDDYGKASVVCIRGDKCPEIFSDAHYKIGGLSTKEQIEAAAAQDISYEIKEIKHGNEKGYKNERI
ncbi:hypothetical protein HYZ41_01640 [archaeon]|nr:hypothetical protein [archaeon]